VQIAQSKTDVGYGVKNVRSNNEVEGTGFKSLIRGRLFQVEGFRLDLRKGGELLHRMGKESCRHISESVGVEPALQRREKLCGKTAGASADF